MDKTIEILSGKVLHSLSEWSFPDQAYMLREIAEKLKEMAEACLELEYGLKDKKSE
jgi:hypothetical protein